MKARKESVVRAALTALVAAAIALSALGLAISFGRPAKREVAGVGLRPRRRAHQGRPQDLPPRHVRRRGVLGRAPAAARSDRRREARRRRAGREPRGGALRGPEGRRRRPAAEPRRARSREGKVDLTDPATTLALLKLDSVVGVPGFFDRGGRIASMGIQCALCHSTVDDSFSPGIGRRLDGWANRDLNVGAIVALAPDLSPFTTPARRRRRHGAWRAEQLGAGEVRRGAGARRQGLPPGRRVGRDADPAGLRPRGREPPHVHGLGLRHPLERPRRQPRDARQGDVLRSPPRRRREVPRGRGQWVRRRAQRARTGSRPSWPRCTSTSWRSPRRRRPRGSFDRRAAARGERLFHGRADCARCHVPPLFTEPGWNMHTADEIGIDDFQAKRSPDERYRTTPLRASGQPPEGRLLPRRAIRRRCWTSSSTTMDSWGSGLSASEKTDLVEYLKSL